MNPLTKIPLTLTLGEIETILLGLGEMPLKISVNVFFSVRQQRDAALAAAAPQPPAEASPTVTKRNKGG